MKYSWQAFFSFLSSLLIVLARCIPTTCTKMSVIRTADDRVLSPAEVLSSRKSVIVPKEVIATALFSTLLPSDMQYEYINMGFHKHEGFFRVRH